MYFPEMDQIARRHKGLYFTTMARLSRKVKNKKEKLEKLLASKNLNLKVYYVPRCHAWCISDQILGCYWRACEIIEKGVL